MPFKYYRLLLETTFNLSTAQETGSTNAVWLDLVTPLDSAAEIRLGAAPRAELARYSPRANKILKSTQTRDVAWNNHTGLLSSSYVSRGKIRPEPDAPAILSRHQRSQRDAVHEARDFGLFP